MCQKGGVVWFLFLNKSRVWGQEEWYLPISYLVSWSVFLRLALNQAWLCTSKTNSIIWLGHRVGLIWQSWMGTWPNTIFSCSVWEYDLYNFLFHLFFHINYRNSTNALAPSNILLYLRLLVVLHGHGNDIQSNHACDEQIQIMGGTHLVNQKSEARVIRVVGFTLCFWKKGGGKGEKQIR